MIVFGSFLHFLFYRFKIGLIKGNLNIVKFQNLLSFIRKNVLKTIQYDKQHYQRLQTIYSTDDDIIECLSIFTNKMSPSFISNLVWFNRPPSIFKGNVHLFQYNIPTFGIRTTTKPQRIQNHQLTLRNNFARQASSQMCSYQGCNFYKTLHK